MENNKQNLNIFDESAITTYVQEKIQESFSPIKRTHNSFNFRCSICGDSKKSMRKMRGHYYPHTNSYYCFNCDYSAQGLWVISALLGNDISEIKRDFIQWSRSDSSIEEVNKEIIPEKPKAKKQTSGNNSHWVEIPDKIKPIIEIRKIYEAPFRPKNWKLYWNKKSKRIVLPWLKDGKIIYYQERAVTKKQSPKYLFPEDTEKPIFGLDEIDQNFPFIFLFEGAFDSIWCKNGIAIGGKRLTKYQEEFLFPYTQEKVYFLDNQWKDLASFEQTEKIINQNINQKIFIWPKNIQYKDLNECSMENDSFINNIKDINFLNSNIFHGARALLQLKN